MANVWMLAGNFFFESINLFRSIHNTINKVSAVDPQISLIMKLLDAVDCENKRSLTNLEYTVIAVLLSDCSSS